MTEDGLTNVPSRPANAVDTRSGTPVAAPTGSMNRRRRQHTLTVLADGSVLATGGQSTMGGGGQVDLANAVYDGGALEPGDRCLDTARARRGRARVPLDGPSAAGWPRAHRRWWHLLRLPAGRLPAPRPGDLHPALPLPPRRQRPARRAPADQRRPARHRVRRRVRAHLTAGGDIRKVGLLRLGAPTHSEDQSQRYVPLGFSAAGTTLRWPGPTTPTRRPRATTCCSRSMPPASRRRARSSSSPAPSPRRRRRPTARSTGR